MFNSDHEGFIEELLCVTPNLEKKMAECKENLAKHVDDTPLSIHLAYYSEQLGKFEMVESDEEEEDMVVELQCLPEDLAATLGCVKRSLMETLNKAGSKKKMKHTAGASTSWGPVLASRRVTRNHGNVKIMDKATAYMQNKNLEIPPTSMKQNKQGQG